MKLSNASSQVSPFVMSHVSPDLFNLAVGQPGASLIPREMLNAAIQRTILSNIDPYIYQYTTALGAEPFRRDLVKFLANSKQYPSTLRVENTCISFGNSHGLSMAVQTLTKPGDNVLIEDPTYFLIGNILRDAHVNIHTCPIGDEEGLDMDVFEEIAIKTLPKLVYVNPVHHNPTGTCLSVRRREKLIQLAVKHDFIILSDEPYILLDYRNSMGIDAPVHEKYTSLEVTASRLFGPNFANLLCFGSFSKILTPGLRIGWITGSEMMIRSLSRNGALSSGGGPASIIAETIRTIIVCGELKELIHKLRQQFKERADAVCLALRTQLGSLVKFHEPQGGYFVYVSFSDGRMSSFAFQEFLEKNGIPVKFLAGSKCSASSATPNGTCSSFRIAVSFYTPEELVAAIEWLKRGYVLWRKSTGIPLAIA